MLSERTLIRTNNWMFNTMRHWSEHFTNLAHFSRVSSFQCLTWVVVSFIVVTSIEYLHSKVVLWNRPQLLPLSSRELRFRCCMLRLPYFASQIWTIQVSNCTSWTCICLIFIKDPILCSSGSSLTKSLSSHIKSSMLWCSTSFVYQIPIKQNPEETVINYQCSGTRVCLFSVRGKSLIMYHQEILLSAPYL